MKQSEKTLVGVAMLVGGIALFVAVGLPQFDALNTNNAAVATLNDDLKNLQSQKESLTAQIAILEKNTDIPSDIKVKTYTEKNREEIIKQLLDQVVGLSTGAGNKFISLIPAKVDPLLVAAAVEEEKTKKDEAKAATDKAAASGSGETAVEEPPAPLLNTFGYELAVRGTYDTIQQFLKSMTEQKELLEISAISIANESNAKGSSGTDAVYDPSYPIKLTATIRLAMQPVSP